jgi:hypothetical protein
LHAKISLLGLLEKGVWGNLPGAILLASAFADSAEKLGLFGTSPSAIWQRLAAADSAQAFFQQEN